MQVIVTGKQIDVGDSLRDHVMAATAYVLAAAEDAGATGADGEPLLIAELRTSIPKLSVSEAMMRLDLAALPAFLFRNGARGNLNLVYRRSDGNVGWIDPDLAAPRRARGANAP